MRVFIKKLREDAIIPKYQTPGSAGFDVHALINEKNPLYSNGSLVVPPQSQCIVPTGLAFSIPDGYELQIRPRSGLAAKKQITITNSPGTLDCVPRGTDIQTPYGTVKVEDIYEQESPVVYSLNEDSQEIESDLISHMWIVSSFASKNPLPLHFSQVSFGTFPCP